MENTWFDKEFENGTYVDLEMVEDLLREALEDSNPRVAKMCQKALDGSRYHFDKAAAILAPRLRIQAEQDDILDRMAW